MNLEIIKSIPTDNLKKTPLLFIHGGYHAAWCWEEHFMPYFSKKGYPCYALSLRGHGKSEGFDKLDSFSLADFVEDVLNVMSGIEGKPVLLGHSMGGGIIQKLLSMHQEKVKGAVLLNSVAYSGMGIGTVFRMLFDDFNNACKLGTFNKGRSNEFPVSGLFSKYMPEEKMKKYGAKLQRESFKASTELMKAVIKNPEKVTVPVLAIGGLDDWFVAPQEIVKVAKPYNAKAVLNPKCGHNTMLDVSWEKAAEEIYTFLTKYDF